MNKRKYVVRKQDLYKSINHIGKEYDYYTDRTFYQNNMMHQGREHQLKMTPNQFIIYTPEQSQASKQNHHPLISSHQNSIEKSNKKHKHKPMSKSLQKNNTTTILKPIINNKHKNTIKKNNIPINFSSSLQHNNCNKKTINNNKSIQKHNNNKGQKRKSIQKSSFNHQTVNINPINQLNDRQHQQQCLHYGNNQNKENTQKQQENNQTNIVNNLNNNILVDKCTQVQQTIKFQKQIQAQISQQYFNQIQSRLNLLQNELHQKQTQIQQLSIIQTKYYQLQQQHQQQILQLYQQNQQLSSMLRHFQLIIEQNNQQFIDQTQNQLIQLKSKLNQTQSKHQQTSHILKQTQSKYKILQAERDTLIRKKDRQNQQIQKLNEIITLKQSQINQSKQNYQLLLNQNQQIIKAYQKMKSQLEQALKINQTQKFLQSLVQKTQQQSTKINLQVESFRCQKCHQIIYGNQNTMDDLAKYHLNQKFQNHIKTYQDQLQYWKDQVQFMKTQHQHEILNIKTILQCTYQKSLNEKETKWYEQIEEYKKTIDIQQQFIQNYKNILEKKTSTNQKLFNKIEVNQNQNYTPIKIPQSFRINQQTIQQKDLNRKKSSRFNIDSQLKSHSARLSYASDFPKNSQLIDSVKPQVHSRLFDLDKN